MKSIFFMHQMSRQEFERMVSDGMKAIPERFLRKLNNLAIVIEDEPTTEQKKKLKMRANWILFGLYEGVPQISRGSHYGLVVPDKITIFQKPIEAEADSKKEIKKMVEKTIWHEIAHHFGMDEIRVRQAEKKKKIFQ